MAFLKIWSRPSHNFVPWYLKRIYTVGYSATFQLNRPSVITTIYLTFQGVSNKWSNFMVNLKNLQLTHTLDVAHPNFDIFLDIETGGVLGRLPKMTV